MACFRLFLALFLCTVLTSTATAQNRPRLASSSTLQERRSLVPRWPSRVVVKRRGLSTPARRTVFARGIDGKTRLCACVRTALQNRWRRSTPGTPHCGSPISAPTDRIGDGYRLTRRGRRHGCQLDDVSSAELLTSAAGAVDDALRNTPGFLSLFSPLVVLCRESDHPRV